MRARDEQGEYVWGAADVGPDDYILPFGTSHDVAVLVLSVNRRSDGTRAAERYCLRLRNEHVLLLRPVLAVSNRAPEYSMMPNILIRMLGFYLPFTLLSL